ncbi:MAG TPA: hypothetical protein VGL93_03660 [Streptosporangiaceae bacterium]
MAGRGVTAADDEGVDDVAFLAALVDWSAGRCGTAPDRSVVAGVSNGAFMAHRLALEASGRAAVVAAAGGVPAAPRSERGAPRPHPLLGGDRRALGRHRPLPARPRRDPRYGGLTPRDLGGRCGRRPGRRLDDPRRRPHLARLTPEPEWNEPGTQEFDAAEEICRFAAPLLAPASARRL